MSAQTKDSQITANRESDIEALARETDMPVAIVQQIYKTEHAKLDQIAKIKTFVPILIRRRVKELLERQRSALKPDVLNQPSA